MLEYDRWFCLSDGLYWEYVNPSAKRIHESDIVVGVKDGKYAHILKNSYGPIGEKFLNKSDNNVFVNQGKIVKEVSSPTPEVDTCLQINDILYVVTQVDSVYNVYGEYLKTIIILAKCGW